MVPVALREAHGALRTARGQAGDDAASARACRRASVRTTRCGAPSSAVVTTVSSTAGREVALLHHVGHVALLGEQEAGAHRDAVGAPGERGDEAAPVVEAARAEHRDLRARPRRRPAGSSSEVGTAPVWPPPSPPWAITASTPQLEHLLGVAAGADGRHHQHAGVVQPRRWRPSSGAPAKDTRRTPSPATNAMRSSGRAGRPGSSRRTGRSVRSFTERTAVRSSRRSS